MTDGRWELLRALGAVADSPAAAAAVAPSLGLDVPAAAEHTGVFVLNTPPYASVYLGPEGALGGEGTDRAAGFWRALALTPPAEPDHLTGLLSLYAHLGQAAAGTRRPATATALARSRAALFSEHLWPWLPAYLDAVTDVAGPALTAWATLARRALTAEHRDLPAQPGLALALRAAPPPLTAEGRISDLTSALTTPARSGIILTRRQLAAGAGQAGVGHRIGERRFTLHAMLDQDPIPTLTWLAGEARRWQRRHQSRGTGDATSRWWHARAAHTVQVLHDAATARTRRAAPAERLPGQLAGADPT